jgi:hypothetical protein
MPRSLNIAAIGEREKPLLYVIELCRGKFLEAKIQE